MKRWLLAVGLVVTLMASTLIGCSSPDNGSESISIINQQEGISVNGQGKVAVTPDVAILTLGVQSQDSTVVSAQTKANEAMSKVLSALTGNGIANKDIQTQRFSIQVVTRYDPATQQEVVTGYSVTNTVTVKVRALDKVGTIIDAAATAGGNFIRIDGISFSVENSTTYYAQAREKAIADAKAKAEQMAKLVGVTMGKPIYISESEAFPVYLPMAAEAGAVGDTSVSPGEIEISATVQVVYAISN